MTRFIAEIGSNHNNDLGRCLQLVDAAAQAGCEAVKLQVFRVEELFAPQALEAHPELQARRAWELPLEFLGPVRERCEARGVELGATPFATRAVQELADHVDFFKIASYELPWPALIRACAWSGKPLVLSTGMATLQEVGTAVEVARSSGVSELRLLHCVSGYPTPPEQANLRAIATLRERFAVPVGWSDHTCSERVVRRAVSHWGAGDVELHIDLDGLGHEAGEHNWTPARLRGLIASLAADSRHAEGERADTEPAAQATPESADAASDEDIDGDGIKRPMPVEEPDVSWRADPVDGLRPARQFRPALRVGV
ncbi:MAG TPA: N-acetylneuraminate synthase family protein [Solirubrobacteraceae bacterium]|jgi:N-acetylneuraminate synthase